jgi:hypothetical protein
MAAEEFSLLAWSGDGPNAAEAMWFRPHAEICADDVPEDGQRAEANAEAIRATHRVCLWGDGFSAPVVGALLRHELEHARHWLANPGVVADLHELALALLREKAGGLDGCMGFVLNSTPEEEDCNAAAASYLREHHPGAVAEICRGPHRRLACSLVGPQDAGTLPARMVAWMFVHRDLSEAHAQRRGFAFRDLVDMCSRGAGEMWDDLDTAARRLG